MKSGRTNSRDFMKGSAQIPRMGLMGTVLTESDRFKPEMWSKVAEEMAVPWRAAEAMHWQLGEADMARRAGVIPFSLQSVTLDTAPPGHSRGHTYSQSHSGAVSVSSSGSRYSRSGTAQPSPSGRGSSSRTIAARRESTPRSVPPHSPSDGLALAAIGSGMAMGMGRGGGQMLPSVAEMTTGVSPYNAPAYSMSMSMSGGGNYSPPQTSPYTILPALGTMQPRPESKRRGSPDMGPRETSRRRQ